jgi:Domain of unknown function (DUF4382)
MRAKRFICATVPALVLAACSGSSENTGTTQAALTGPVELRAANNDAAAIAASLAPVAPQVAGLVKIVVTVARVDAKVDVDALGREHDDDDSWVTVAIGPFPLDLLGLQGGTFGTLGVTQLPAGDVDSLRLVLQDGPSSYVVTSAGAKLPLVVPSGEQAGIRVTGDFEAQACATGHVTLEFAGRHSIQIHPDGDGDAYILRPVIHLSEVDMTGVCADPGGSTQPPSKEPHGEGAGS